MRLETTLATSSSSAECIEKITSVCAIVSTRAANWSALQQVDWESLLPQWFLDACAPPMSAAEAQAFLERWRKLSPADRTALTDAQAWSLPDWLHWMNPEQATWSLAASETLSPNLARVVLEVDGWPVAIGSFRWLAKAAGAVKVDVGEPA